MLGIARTMARTSGNRWRRLAASAPARSETITVLELRNWRSSGATSSSFCGLNASTTRSGGDPASAKLRTVVVPSTGVPLGRITVTAPRFK